ncbi:hypothetical protein [Umezawaea tangerina]|uniref:Secreted protein n=1 Tax=Umezawaea tangerina TaxID=84725 RepID=A0A2T0SE11_9PSEU|nr:hypothetical protein [Umezawaea tangerina]PRY31656.1 hypothetical protein CLV43_12262 [Umezawaea tangerina]
MRTLLVVLCAIGLAWGTTLPASADGAQDGADVQVAQTLGARELTVVIRRVEPVPGPVHVEVVTHAGTPAGELALRLSQDGAVVSEAKVVLGATPGFHGATLRVSGPGPWELAVDDGVRVATIPFVVPARVMSPWQNAAYGGFVAAGVLLLVSLLVAVRGHGRAALVPAGGVVAALAVAVTAALLSASIPPPAPPGRDLDPTVDNVTDPYAATPPSTTDYSRPPVNLVATRDGDLRLTMTDGSTGRPVDDLLVHDNALVHLGVVSPSGRLWHLHPVRVGPGDYRVALDTPETGRYAVAAEIARRGGGRQLLRTTIALDATGTSAPATESVELVRKIAEAGSPSTITARFGTPDLQPWLGMVGHMIVTGPVTGEVADAPVWGHVHSMAPPTPGRPDRPDESVAAFGPDVPFTYTFPLPGRYLVWVQAERGYSVRTVPAVVDVPAAEGATR